MRRIPKLVKIADNQCLPPEFNQEFLVMLNKALLLALKERGKLNAMQYRYAESVLKRQEIERVRKKQEGL